MVRAHRLRFVGLGSRPPRSRAMPSKRSPAKRLRHRPTIVRSIDRAAAICRLSFPSAASRTIFARAATMDEFDLVQLAHVVRVCRESPTLSAAGRRLFAASRARRGSPNDADRLRKYLARFGLDWRTLKPGAPRGA